MSGKPRPVEKRFWSKVKIFNNKICWGWTGGKYRNGYGQFYRNPNKITAHRMAFILANGEISKNLFVCHKCDNRACVNPAHLFLGTASDNIRDMVSKGRQVKTSRKGVNNGRAVLTEKDVRYIRKLYASKIDSAKIIGEVFNISESQVLRIVNRESWKHI